jgi:hypothetical protein
MSNCEGCSKTKEIMDAMINFFPISEMMCMTCNKKVDRNTPIIKNINISNIDNDGSTEIKS